MALLGCGTEGSGSCVGFQLRNSPHTEECHERDELEMFRAWIAAEGALGDGPLMAVAIKILGKCLNISAIFRRTLSDSQPLAISV